MELTLAYLLIGLGLGLMGAELFFPTGGILFLCALAAVIAGIALTFIYGDSAIGLTTLVGVCFAGPLIFALFVNLWPRTSLGRKMIVEVPADDETLANMPVNLELEALRGRHGQTLSDLRPSGAVSFDGKRIDVMSEGPMIPVGVWVRCIDVKAGRVIVRRVEAPDLNKVDFNDIKT